MLKDECKDCLWYSAQHKCMLPKFVELGGEPYLDKGNMSCFEPLIPEVMEMTTCPLCNSTNVAFKASMHSDLFTCNECKYEWRS